jgi:arylsulfatase A-like enzyme
MYVDPDYKGLDIIHPIPGPAEGYLTPEELQHVKNLYAGKISLCDKWIGWFLDEIRNMGLYDDTLIIFTTDHGEPFNEHGFLKKAEPGLYEELAHIPLIIRHPDGIGAGQRFEAMVETTEIFPTVLDYFGVKQPPRIHGRSLLPMMRGEEEKIRDYAYMGYYKQAWRVSDQEWAFMLNFGKGKTNELYNLKNDPGEQDNLIDREPAKAMELELELRRFVAGLK